MPGSSDRFGRKPVILVASSLGLVLPLMACIALAAMLRETAPRVLARRR
jgi:hypothetical protein